VTSAANEQPDQLKSYASFAPSEMYFNGMLYYAVDTIAPGPLRKLGTNTTPQKLRDYILNTHGFAGPSGFYDFRSGDGHGLDESAIIFVRWDPKKGDFVNASRRGGAPL
jgi:hypothetical protein